MNARVLAVVVTWALITVAWVRVIVSGAETVALALVVAIVASAVQVSRRDSLIAGRLERTSVVLWPGAPEAFRSDEGAVVESVADKLKSFGMVGRLKRENIIFDERVAAVLHKNFSDGGSGGALVAGALVEHAHESLVVGRPSGG
jgi:hypothetical protein